jgi:hypothetical protein
MTTITLNYTASVFTPAGWRSVTITADADQTSAGMARVTRVTAIDGEAPAYDMSRTGAKRQSFNGHAIAKREIGARKRLSACTVQAAA